MKPSPPVLALALGGALAACDSVEANPDRELTVGVSAAPTSAAPGGSLQFTVAATGSGLVGVLLDYGDQSADTVELNGATTATVRRDHAFAAPGDYTVRAIAEERSGARARDSLQVSIQPGG